MEYKSLQRKTILLNILRFLVPFLAFVGCFALGLLWDDNASFFITLALAVLAVASFIYFSNKVKRNLLILEDLIFTNALKGIYDKKKTTNARSFLNISELVRNKLLIEPYKRYGFLYYEVVYNRVVIDSSNLTLEYFCLNSVRFLARKFKTGDSPMAMLIVPLISSFLAVISSLVLLKSSRIINALR